MTQFGKLMVAMGVLLLVVGAVWWGIGRLGGEGTRGLPGDLFYEGERVTVVAPLATCVLLSILLSLALWLWQWLSR